MVCGYFSSPSGGEPCESQYYAGSWSMLPAPSAGFVSSSHLKWQENAGILGLEQPPTLQCWVQLWVSASFSHTLTALAPSPSLPLKTSWRDCSPRPPSTPGLCEGERRSDNLWWPACQQLHLLFKQQLYLTQKNLKKNVNFQIPSDSPRYSGLSSGSLTAHGSARPVRGVAAVEPGNWLQGSCSEQQPDRPPASLLTRT